MKSNVCYIVGAGYFDKDSFDPRPGDYIIAADGGYRYLIQSGAVPDIVLGDFDSLGAAPDFKNVRVYPAAKDDTDTMIAARLAVENGFSQVRLFGVSGGDRFDHTIASIAAMSFLSRRGILCSLYAKEYDAYCITNRSLTLPASGGYISVFALGGAARGVDLHGLVFPLCGATIEPDDPIGCSNRFAAPEATVSVSDGTLLITVQK